MTSDDEPQVSTLRFGASVRCVALNSLGTMLAIGGDGKELSVWDLC